MCFIMYTGGLNHFSDRNLNEKVSLLFWEPSHENILQIGMLGRGLCAEVSYGVHCNLCIFLFDCLSRQTGKSTPSI